MNTNQKIVLIGVAVVLLLQLVFFTPFEATTTEGIVIYPHGNFFSKGYIYSVDTANFILYWGIIFIFGGIAFYLAKDTKRD